MLHVSYFGRAKVLVQDELGCFLGHYEMMRASERGTAKLLSITIVARVYRRPFINFNSHPPCQR